MKKIIAICAIAILIMTACEGTKYLVSSNFYQLERGMTEKAFLEWIKPNYVAANGHPSSTKLFTYGSDTWKVYTFDIYKISGTMGYFDHREYVAFKNGRLEEYGTGDLPITIRQNPNSYNLNINNR